EQHALQLGLHPPAHGRAALFFHRLALLGAQALRAGAAARARSVVSGRAPGTSDAGGTAGAATCAEATAEGRAIAPHPGVLAVETDDHRHAGAAAHRERFLAAQL